MWFDKLTTNGYVLMAFLMPIGELLLNSKIRHSSVGWNPVHRIFKHSDGLGHILRWDDGIIRSSHWHETSTSGLFGAKSNENALQC